MKNQISWVVSITILLFVSSCHKTENNTSSDFIVNDPASQALQKKAQSFPFLFQSDTNKLYARILQANNDNPKPTVIFLHGNPGFEKNEDIGQALRRNGINAVYFSYTGTWGNPGLFSYAQSIIDTRNLITFLAKNTTRFQIDTSNLFICGFSMGADIALLAAKEIAINPRGFILIDPWHGYEWLQSKNDRALLKYEKALENRPAVNIPNGKQFTKEILKNRSYNLSDISDHSDIPTIYFFSSDEIEKKFISSINNTTIYYKTLNASDHSFSNKRVALTKEIFNWISSHL